MIRGKIEGTKSRERQPVLGRLEYESGLESDSRPLFKDSDSYSDSCP